MKPSKRRIELLSPAKNADIAIEALRHGADAVYLGAPSHGARKAAANSIADIARVIDYAHRFRARVYVTLNTLVYSDEISAVERLIGELYRIGTDALIIQDMGILRMDIPPIALHASTQTDIRTPRKALFMAQAGFSQLVLPREMTLDEMKAVRDAVPADVSLEAFVHGALCVSYSGDCQAGFVTAGRSANRGECPQICRHCFNLTDASGNVIIRDRHLLSLRDLNRAGFIPQMLEAGIDSFKIEGRLKDAAYVKNVTAAYRDIIDRAIAERPEEFERVSIGSSALGFTPDLSESFNRGYTSYFTTGSRPKAPMASMLTPKWAGKPIGTVIGCSGKAIRARLKVPVANGDGLGYFTPSGRFEGFRVNRAEGSTLFPASPQTLRPGTELYRNHNSLWDNALASDTARRTITVDLDLRLTPSGIALDIADRFGNSASAATQLPRENAQKPQAEARLATLSKLGDTDFSAGDINDSTGRTFIPLSRLAALRREAADALADAIAATHPFDRRRKEEPAAQWPEGTGLSYHDNVANPLAAKFYRDHGVSETSCALETSAPAPRETRVMTTRYCLRRETGHCLLTPGGRDWPRELYLESGPDRFRLDFDCRACRMHLVHLPSKR